MSGNSTNNLLLENIVINVVFGIISVIILILIITILSIILKKKKCLKQVIEEIPQRETTNDNYRTPNPLYNNENLEPPYETIETSL